MVRLSPSPDLQKRNHCYRSILERYRRDPVSEGMTDHEKQQLVLRRGKVLDALARAEHVTVTRPAPKSRA